MEENNTPENPDHQNNQDNQDKNNTPTGEQPEGKIADVSDLFDEEVEPVKQIDSAEVDESDFSVDQEGKEKTPDPEESKEAEDKNTGEKKSEEKAAAKNSGADSDEKNAVIKRMFNPATAMLMFDILTKRAGRMVKPKNPDYLRMSEEDRKDFEMLLKHTAQEEDWSEIPTKYLLMVAAAFWIFGKAYKWNKPHLWDEMEAGKGFQAKADEKVQETKDNEAAAAYIRERAKLDSDNALRDLQEMVRVQSQQSAMQGKQIQNLLDIISGNMTVPGNMFQDTGSGISDVPFVEIAPERYLDNYDMEIIEFTSGGCIVDKSKAGTEGFTMQGRKDGKPSGRDAEIQKHFNKYHLWKKKHLKKVA